MKVKLLTSLSGPGRNHAYGEIIEMEDDEAVRFIEREMAVPVRDDENTENTSAKQTDKENAVINFAKLKTKAEIVAAAKEVHGLNLDEAQTKKELLAAIDAHAAPQPPAEEAGVDDSKKSE